jgi:hypothetical protein
MLSQSPGIYIILAAVVSGTLLIINNLWLTSINNKFQLEREKQQSIRQEESERQKWYREKIYDSYRSSIKLLREMMQIQYEIEQNHMVSEAKGIEFHKLALELMSEFDIIIHSYPAQDFKEFEEKITEFTEHLETNTLRARSILNKIMENDSRIKNIND